MSPIALDRAYLTAIWLETLFYGVNLSLFCYYLFITKSKRRDRPVRKLLFSIATLMFLFSTIHVSLGFARLIEGFIVRRDRPGGPAAFFSDVSIPANVAKVWRCYHVWGQSWPISIGPILFLIASAICGFGQAYIFAHAKTAHNAFETQLSRWNGSLFSISLATNLIVTCLIAFRIWYLSRQFAFLGANSQVNYRRITFIIVESGAIYSSALIIEITLYFLGSNAFYIIYDPIAQLTAIVPTTIIILTFLGITSNEYTTTQVHPSHMAVESSIEFSGIDTTRKRGKTKAQIRASQLFTSAISQDVEADYEMQG
ncbi:hypothetical protein D9758_006347 [Tetrapyrgos nigripes]|uniref:Uncharacterized protein n=1 Tax=Tetrapyrgos nigripes TaxID=182062 RepID=A0A8H5D9B8_9AGAR|nr:hypothetical protein D9758_006347 [Tetrapyrgos nigripes]